MEDEFNLLAVRTLSGDATPEEAARLDQLLEQDAELRTEFIGLRAAWAALRQGGPLAEAINEPPAQPPQERLKEWERAVAEKFVGARVPKSGLRNVPAIPERKRESIASLLRIICQKWLTSPLGFGLAACVILAAAIVTILLGRHSGATSESSPAAYLVMREGAAEVRREGNRTTTTSAIALRSHDKVVLPVRAAGVAIVRGGSVTLRGPQRVDIAQLSKRGPASPTNAALASVQRALFEPAEKMAGLLLVKRGSQSIRVYSPVGVTASLTPVILWSNEPGKTYDLALRDHLRQESAALRLTKAVAPIEFGRAWPRATLAKDGLYRLLIAETGQPLTATEVTFRTLAEAGDNYVGSPNLLGAYQSLTADPPRMGDALAQLFALPSEGVDDQLAMRLKLLAFGQLGYEREFYAIFNQLQGSPTKP